MESTNEIQKKITVTGISVDRVYKSDYQKAKTQTAQLRQTLTSVASYPSTKVSNSKNGNIFGAEDFGFEAQNFTSVENRVAFINVPEGTTPEQVIAKLGSFPAARLYKTLSNKPIITDDQAYAIANGVGDLSMEKVANSQVVRYPDNHESKAGQIILDNAGKVQYRAVFFSPSGQEDEDFRTADVADAFVSPEIMAELAGAPASATVVAGQGIN